MLEQTHAAGSIEAKAGPLEQSKLADISHNYFVIRRNGKQTPFDQNKIKVALTKAFLAVEGGKATSSNRIHQIVDKLTFQIATALFRRISTSGILHIEEIQDQVELALMRSGEHKVARAYVLYREEHLKKRQVEKQEQTESQPQINIVFADESTQILDWGQLENLLNEVTQGITDVSVEKLLATLSNSLFDGIRQHELNELLVLTARKFIDQEPNYSQVAARLLLNSLTSEALTFVNGTLSKPKQSEMHHVYPDYFRSYIARGIELGLLDEELGRFDLTELANAIDAERDLQFNYLGLQTLYDRYFIHSKDTRIELPQAFFMRVAMGLAINEIEREEKAVEFYRLLSSFDFMSSTPTLFNSGTPRPQLSSCYLTTVPDQLYGIYDSLKDNAMLSKFAGGLGNDWTRVRGMGAYIKGTNGKSQGVVPFLKVANDTAVAVNQGGKRKGAMCAYLESWHIDIEDFLELRKNTGDERRRTHDMNTANWIPDLFMQRVIEEKDWTLFSPEEVPELHELSGKDFKEKYEFYEQQAANGLLVQSKKIKAVDLWRKMLGMLFETGHPWITFKDPCNIRYTNQHQGVVHSSNLCTEITLHTNDNEIAVCNLGSVNLAQHINAGELDTEKLERTISVAMRMLDNVIEYNYYSVPSARNSNLKHRPVGLGIMGFQDALYQLKLAYASEEAVAFADSSSEIISYFAIQASMQLAQERGSYSTYQGSLWSRGILPIDSVKTLAEERGNYFNQNTEQTLDWDSLRHQIQQYGMRNS
ncbi:MAG: ribonucleoside-diphosphate reductase subunit alpha, partial [Kangiellaceae bacterium]|nr:ribonucleoside-diphosphate reductase subunit alpha [Kangiellaceae bacterium]